jgi:hypothetical protein
MGAVDKNVYLLVSDHRIELTTGIPHLRKTPEVTLRQVVPRIEITPEQQLIQRHSLSHRNAPR